MRLSKTTSKVALHLVIRLFALLLVLFTLLGYGELQSSEEPIYALWITRFDYLTAQDVREIVQKSADAGFNTLLFQVRGNATVFYRSSYEPWAEQLGGQDPGFDPLGVALEQAHKRGLKLHAWVNVIPAWRGLIPPTDRGHLYHVRPEWFWYDQYGKRQPLSENFYVSLNPCLPEVREYLTELLKELISGYDIDGLHLDYIRFPNEAPGTPPETDIDYPRDARTLALYREATGKAPEKDPESWDNWRVAQLSALVRDIRAMVSRVKPDLVLSAVVEPLPELSLEHYQDYRTWIEEGLVDIVFPMNYAGDEATFEKHLKHWRELGEGPPVVMGVMIAGDYGVRARQLRSVEAAFGHVSIFAYHSLFDSRNTETESQDIATREQRQERRAYFLPLFSKWTHR